MTSTLTLPKVNLSNSNNDIYVNNVDTGFGLKQQCKRLDLLARSLIDLKYELKSESLTFLVVLCSHIKEESPLGSYFGLLVLANYFINKLSY